MGITLKKETARKLAQWLQKGEDAPPARPARGGVNGLATGLVRCLSDEAAGDGGAAAQCFPGELLASDADATRPDSQSEVWLTLWSLAGAVTPEPGGVYHCILAGRLDIDGDERTRAFGGDFEGGDPISGSGISGGSGVGGGNGTDDERTLDIVTNVCRITASGSGGDGWRVEKRRVTLPVGTVIGDPFCVDNPDGCCVDSGGGSGPGPVAVPCCEEVEIPGRLYLTLGTPTAGACECLDGVPPITLDYTTGVPGSEFGTGGSYDGWKGSAEWCGVTVTVMLACVGGGGWSVLVDFGGGGGVNAGGLSATCSPFSLSQEAFPFSAAGLCPGAVVPYTIAA